MTSEESQTPITAEALRAAGWQRFKTWLTLKGSCVCVKQSGDKHNVYSFCGTVNGHMVELRAYNVGGMTDLAELVRLIGAKP